MLRTSICITAAVLVVMGVFGHTQAGTPTQSLDHLARQTILAFDRAGEIPHQYVEGWLTRGPKFRAMVTRMVLPGEQAALRHYWSGSALHYILTYDASAPLGLNPSCCAQIKDLRTQSYVTSDDAIKLRVSLMERISYVTHMKRTLTECKLTWSDQWNHIWWDLTYRHVRGRLRAIAFNTSWAANFHG